MNTLIERINNYLEAGGLFNPEMMNGDMVRDLLMDARGHIMALEEVLRIIQYDFYYYRTSGANVCNKPGTMTREELIHAVIGEYKKETPYGH